MKIAIILLSGGLDSTTCLAYAKAQGFTCHTLSFNYGQRHAAELEAAKKIAKHYDAPHHIFDLPIAQFGGSALTDTTLDVPHYDEHQHDEIPITYVPARNTIFLSIALALAETLNANDIFIGVSAIDYSNYPDCRPEYIQAFQAMANLATKAGVENATLTIHTPLIHLSKAETIQLGHELGVDYAMTVSCYQLDSEGQACGKCDSCTLRKNGFVKAAVKDPTHYTNSK